MLEIRCTWRHSNGFFPLTPALSLRERVPLPPCFVKSSAPVWSRTGRMFTLSLRERAGVRGKRLWCIPQPPPEKDSALENFQPRRNAEKRSMKFFQPKGRNFSESSGLFAGKIWRQPTLAESIKPLPSARLCLTAVFGMGTGRTTALWPPKIGKR